MNSNSTSFRSNREQIRQSWNSWWANKNFRLQIIITFLVLAAFPFMFHEFFDFVESRQGTKLDDILLNIIPAFNLSWIVFFCIYTGLALQFYCNLSRPEILLLGFQTYILVTLFRVVTITLCPLEPPTGYIPLQEPFVQMFTSGGRIISKDLFFSGHVSTITSMFLSIHHKFFRPVLFIFVIVVSLSVLFQHVHYTIDVLAAPVGTIMCFWFCKNYLGEKLL